MKNDFLRTRYEKEKWREEEEEKIMALPPVLHLQRIFLPLFLSISNYYYYCTFFCQMERRVENDGSPPANNKEKET